MSFRGRTRKITLPKGWSPDGKVDGKPVYRCPFEQVTVFTGKRERCIYRARKDRVNLQHTHIFARGSRIEPTGKTHWASNDEFIDSLRREAARLVATLNLPAISACGESMRHFILRVIESSHDFFEDQAFCPRAIIPKFNPNDLGRDIKKLGDEALNCLVEQLRPFRYVNMMIDAATVLGKHYVHVTLSNPYSGLAPLPFNTILKTGPADWCIEDYLSALQQELAKVTSIGALVVMSVCHDRLAAQAQAVAQLCEEALGFEEHERRIIADVPCWNHLLNSVFVHVYNSDGQFKNKVDDIGNIALELRSRQALHYLGRKCPYPPKTRWIYIVDTLLFLHNYCDPVFTYLLQHDVVSKEDWSEIQQCYQNLLLILLPMHEVSLSLECEKSRLSDVIPLLDAMFEIYGDIEQKVTGPFHEMLCNILKEMRLLFRKFMPEETYAAWLVTRNGRAFLRHQNEPPGLCSRYSAKDISNSLNESVEDMKSRVLHLFSQLDILKAKDVSCCDNSRLLEALDFDDTDDLDYIDESKYEEEEEEEESLAVEPSKETTPSASQTQLLLDSMDFWDCTSLCAPDWHSDAYSRAIQALERYLKVMRNGGSGDVNVTKLFDLWIGLDGDSDESSFRRLDIDNMSTDFRLWQEAYKYDDLRVFARLCLRLLSIGTGESDVERLVSAHRKIVGTSATNMSTDVLLARLRLKAVRLSQEAHDKEETQ